MPPDIWPTEFYHPDRDDEEEEEEEEEEEDEEEFLSRWYGWDGNPDRQDWYP
jgi:hypothetical protein